MSQNAKAPIELDFTDSLKARYTCLCDECGKEIKSHSCCGSTSANVSWTEKESDDAYPEYHSANLCDVACLKAYVAKMEVEEDSE